MIIIEVDRLNFASIYGKKRCSVRYDRYKPYRISIHGKIQTLLLLLNERWTDFFSFAFHFINQYVSVWCKYFRSFFISEHINIVMRAHDYAHKYANISRRIIILQFLCRCVFIIISLSFSGVGYNSGCDIFDTRGGCSFHSLLMLFNFELFYLFQIQLISQFGFWFLLCETVFICNTIY